MNQCSLKFSFLWVLWSYLFVFVTVVWIPHPGLACMPGFPGNTFLLASPPRANGRQTPSASAGWTFSGSPCPWNCPFSKMPVLCFVPKSIHLPVWGSKYVCGPPAYVSITLTSSPSGVRGHFQGSPWLQSLPRYKLLFHWPLQTFLISLYAYTICNA